MAHGTNFDSLISAINGGAVLPAVQGGQDQLYGNANSDYVYLEALPKAFETYYFNTDSVRDGDWWEKNSRMPVYLEIDTSVLDEVSWSHLNVYWMFGEFKKHHSIRPSHLIAGFFNMIQEAPASKAQQKNGYNTVSRINARNEILMSAPVPFIKYVKAIHVDPKQKEDLLQKMREAGVGEEIVRLVK